MVMSKRLIGAPGPTPPPKRHPSAAALLLLASACSGYSDGGDIRATTASGNGDEQGSEPDTSGTPTSGAVVTDTPDGSQLASDQAAIDEASEEQSPVEEDPVTDDTGTPNADTPLEIVRSETCTAPAGVNPRPQNYTELAALLNALPLPVTQSCFLSSLRRPLGLFASFGAASAQPARGIRSPRIFLFSGPFLFTVVPDEEKINILEMGLLTSSNTTVKAELEFPLRQDLDATELARRGFLGDTGTVCGGCHAPEVPFEDPFFEGAYESSVLEPDFTLDASLASVRAFRDECDGTFDSLRCDVLEGIFDHGVIRAEEFEDAVATRPLR